MAQKAIRDVENFTYILASDRKLKPEEQSVFTFRPMTGPERVRVLDGMEIVRVDGSTGEKQIKPCGMQQAYEAALLTLVAVDNFPAGGTPEPYPVKEGREACARYLEGIDDTAVFELGMYSIDRSTLGPPEKNSLTP